MIAAPPKTNKKCTIFCYFVIKNLKSLTIDFEKKDIKSPSLAFVSELLKCCFNFRVYTQKRFVFFCKLLDTTPSNTHQAVA